MSGRRRRVPAGQVPQHSAEPFDDLAVALQLAPLADVSGARSVYLLSILLVLAGSAGLFALYRMVGVTVGFAERRNNFVAAVSHELKTPLTNIRMYAELLDMALEETDDKTRGHLSIIVSESQRLSRLIGNVLLEEHDVDLALVRNPVRTLDAGGPLLERTVRAWIPASTSVRRATVTGAALLTLVPVAIAVGLGQPWDPQWVIVVGLVVFAIVFAINSAVHSYLILAYSDFDKVSMNVGFYYMANAGGRLLGGLHGEELLGLGVEARDDEGTVADAVDLDHG